MKITHLATRVALLAAVVANPVWADGPQLLEPTQQIAFIPDASGYLVSEEQASEPAPSIVSEEDYSSYDCGPVCGEAPGLLGYAIHGGGGLTAEYVYTGEVFTNMRGGITDSDATRYTGRLDAVLHGDLEQLGCMPGGTVFMHFQSLHGEGITDDFVGARQRVSNMDGNPDFPGSGYDFTQISQYWYEQSVCDGLISVRLGKILCDSEFALASRGGDFINTSLGWTHTMPMPAYPNASAGVIGFFQLAENLNFKAGVWDGTPDGRTWGFSDSGEVFSIYEFKVDWALGCGSLPGDSNVGMWHHTRQFADQAGGAAHDGSHGVYWGLSQLLNRENGCDDQGLGTFVQFGWAPEESNTVTQYWGGGLVYTGLVPCRDADTCGVGIGNMTASTDLPSALEDETMIELFYKARLGSHIVIQPDLQYISSPSGGIYDDSFLFGLRFQTVL